MSVFKRPGATVYSYDFRYRSHRFSGSTECTTEREAKRYEKSVRDQVKADEIDTAKPMTFAAASSLYWHEVGQHHRNSVDTERSLAWLQTAVGARTMIADITDATIARLVAKRRGEGLSNATINRYVCEPMRGILRRAEKVWGARVGKVDWSKHVLKEPQERVREATVEEEDRALAAIRDDYIPALRFAFLSGCRRAEIVGLKWSTVSFPSREFRVTGKGDRSRTVPMTQEVFDFLWSLKDDHPEAVFTYVAKKTRDGRVRGKRYPVTYSGFTSAWRRYVKGKLSDFRFHDTRHTAATRLVRATGNIKLAQRLLGHTEIATTGRYAHVTHDDLREGLEAAARSTKRRPGRRKRRRQEAQ